MRRPLEGWVCGAVIVTTLVACSRRASAAEELAPLVWGARPTAGTSHGVALCEGETYTTCSLRCTGSLIGPNLVQLARHCLIRERPGVVLCDGPGVTGELQRADRLWLTRSDRPSPEARWLPAVEVHVSSFTAPCGHDIGYVILSKAAEGEDGIAEPSLDALEDLGGPGPITLSTTGYGAVGRGEAAAGGERATLEGVRVLCIGGRDTCTSKAGPNGLFDNEVLVDAIVCSGDSGGGVHVAETGRVVGAFARIIDPKPDGCGSGVLTRVDRHRLLLARAARRAAALGGYEPAPWVARAEALGNDDRARGLGASCDADEDCAGGTCVSFDGGKHRTCSTACGPCPGGFACMEADRGAFCGRASPPPPASSGCGAVRATPPEELAWLTLAGAYGTMLFVRRRRRHGQ